MGSDHLERARSFLRACIYNAGYFRVLTVFTSIYTLEIDLELIFVDQIGLQPPWNNHTLLYL